jgi:hypothetical protein
MWVYEITNMKINQYPISTTGDLGLTKPFVYPPSCPTCYKPFKVAWDNYLGGYNPHLLEPDCDHYQKNVQISIG